MCINDRGDQMVFETNHVRFFNVVFQNKKHDF